MPYNAILYSGSLAPVVHKRTLADAGRALEDSPLLLILSHRYHLIIWYTFIKCRAHRVLVHLPPNYVSSGPYPLTFSSESWNLPTIILPQITPDIPLHTNLYLVTTGSQKMRQTIAQKFIRKCDTCARIKSAGHPPYGLLKTLEDPVRQWSPVSLDVYHWITHAK